MYGGVAELSVYVAARARRQGVGRALVMAIIAASEALATAVILFRNSTIPAGAEQRARLLITRTLGQLEAAAIRVNILKNWTRQRIDRNHAIRGMAAQGAAQFLFCFGLLHGASNLPAQLARREVAVQLTEARQLQQHHRVAHRLLNKEVAGRTDATERCPTRVRPIVQPWPAVKPGHCSAPGLFGTVRNGH